MDDKAEKIVDQITEDIHAGDRMNFAPIRWRKEISAYGEQCRRAGAEAMREAAASIFVKDKRFLEPDMRHAVELAETVIRLIPLPSAAEAASPAAGWRPIETAPMDGTEVLGICAEAQSPKAGVTWWDDKWLHAVSKPEKFMPLRPYGWWPTHWMPLPSAPTEEARAG